MVSSQLLTFIVCCLVEWWQTTFTFSDARPVSVLCFLKFLQGLYCSPGTECCQIYGAMLWSGNSLVCLQCEVVFCAWFVCVCVWRWQREFREQSPRHRRSCYDRSETQVSNLFMLDWQKTYYVLPDVCPSVRSFVRCQTFEHDILKTMNRLLCYVRPG